MIERLLAAERALAGGNLDGAELLFRQVAEADERNAIAVVGLAEVALARGDAAQAEAFARQALAIDPDDAAAARLLLGTAEAATGPEAATGLEAATGPEAGPPAPDLVERTSLLGRVVAWVRRLGSR
jgi:tetratricopeptide (TPR) repeat protein